jgi:hypothetical protein
MSRTIKATTLTLALLSAFVFPAWADEPATKTVLYRGRDIQLHYPENWSVVENGNFIYIAPDNGFVDGSLRYGMMITTFNPQSGTDYEGSAFSPPGSRESNITLSDATALVVAQFRQWNQNIGMVIYRGTMRIDGIDAMMVDMTNESPTGVMQTDLLITLVRPDGLVTYFVGIAPQIDFGKFRSAFERVLASVRFSE